MKNVKRKRRSPLPPTEKITRRLFSGEVAGEMLEIILG